MAFAVASFLMKNSASPHLQPFVEKEAPGIYALAVCLGLEGGEAPWMSDVFAAFGRQFRALASKKDFVWEPMESRVRLYSLAWKSLKPILSGTSFERFSIQGRDTRQAQRTETDLFATSATEFQTSLISRLRLLDLDHRILIVLRDILQFSDEEAMRVTDLRWGVYRHRLHRGRMDLGTILHGGNLSATTLQPVSVS